MTMSFIDTRVVGKSIVTFTILNKIKDEENYESKWY